MDDTAIPERLAQESAAPRSRSPYTVAVALIAINVRVFLAMVASGVSFTQPTPLGVFKWVSTSAAGSRGV